MKRAALFTASWIGSVAILLGFAFLMAAAFGCDAGSPPPSTALSGVETPYVGTPMEDEEPAPLPKFDVGAPDYCEAFGEPDPGFDIEVDEDGEAVIIASPCQGLYAHCYVSGVGTVDLWCDFECGETMATTMALPTDPGLYSLTFADPCG